jgi:hypothetical protein
MNLKKNRSKFLNSIPHFAELFNVRRNQRYVPHHELAEIRLFDPQGGPIDGKLFDISFDGMRILTTDKRIEKIRTISLSVENFRMDLPVRKIWADKSCYRIEFGDMNRQEFADLEYFVEHLVKRTPDNLLELLM